MASVTITNKSSDLALPDVVLPANLIPSNAVITQVVALFYCSVIRDTSGSDNAINGAADIQVRKSGGSWVDAITISDNMFAVDVTNVGRDRGGAPLIGATNIKTTVDADNATYNFQFDDIKADGANLTLQDVLTGLRIFFY